jgi:two-component system, cell cycle response regulator DivK
VVERLLPKQDIVGSSPITRSNAESLRPAFLFCKGAVMKNIFLPVRITFGASMTQKSIILYVEDNFDNRNLIRRVLEAEGYSMAEAGNAEEAMQKIISTRPDLILMDINMPGMDGYTLTARIKATPGFANVPIVAVTANVMRGDREKSLEAGCDGYIQKPIDIDTLSQQIGRFLTRQSND